jgi:hypothetical protein
MMADIGHAIGDAWRSLAAELERQIRDRDPDARAHAVVGLDGLLRLDVRTVPAQRARARALARSYEDRARTICEQCGAPVVSAGAGPVVTILCARHSPPSEEAHNRGDEIT